MDTKDLIIENSLRTAKEWDLKKNPNWASRSYSSAMLAMLSKAVAACENAEQGVGCLVALDGVACIRHVCRSFQELRTEIVAGKLPWSVVGGNYHLIVFSHVASLLGDQTASAIMLEIANVPEVARLGTKFWSIYAQGMEQLFKNKIFAVPELKPRRGLEEYWCHYLDLLSVVSKKQNLACCLDTIQTAFIARNKDSKINDDQYEIEGSARRSVKWDFRRDAILRLSF